MKCAGRIVRVFPRCVFDTGGVLPGSEDFVVADHLDVLDYGSGLLLLRVHENSLASNFTVTLRLYTTAPAADDPATDFVATKDLAELQVDTNTADGSLHVATVEPAYGAQLRAILTVDNNGEASGGDIELSADLVMRVGTPIPMREMGDFAYTASTSKLFVPFKGITANATINKACSRTMPYPGRLEKVVVYGSGAGGSTVVGFHKNGSGTASATDTQTVAAVTSTEFTFASGASFDAGDRIHISIDPTSALTEVNGGYVLRYDRTWG